jgi:hypothetical protein
MVIHIERSLQQIRINIRHDTIALIWERCLPIFPYNFCIAIVCGLRLYSVNEFDKCGLADLSNICFDELPLIPHMIERYAWEDAAVGSPRYCLDELPLMSHMIEWYVWWDAAWGSSRCCLPVVWSSMKAAVSVWFKGEFERL